MVKYTQLINVPSKECNEPLIKIVNIPNGYLPEMQDMKRVTGNDILVRKDVYNRLLKAQRTLLKINQNYSLYVVYGYRSLKIQILRFLKRLAIVNQKYYANPVDLYESVHRSVAVPSVAGHPTGGAVDLYIIDNRTGKQIDFGSPIYDYSTLKYYVFSGEITNKQKGDRMILRKVMMGAGFAPFDGEWWHFSYGDREWAFYYKKPCAIYNQITYPFSISQKLAPSLSQGRRRSSGSVGLY